MEEYFKAVKVTENVYWVGAIDWSIRNFHGYETGRGSTYNAFLVLDDEDAFDGDVTVLPETTCAAVCFRGSHPEAPAQYARLMDYLRAHALAPADFSREITMIDYGLTSDPDKFVTEIRIPVRASE